MMIPAEKDMFDETARRFNEMMAPSITPEVQP